MFSVLYEVQTGQNGYKLIKINKPKEVVNKIKKYSLIINKKKKAIIPVKQKAKILKPRYFFDPPKKPNKSKESKERVVFGDLINKLKKDAGNDNQSKGDKENNRQLFWDTLLNSSHLTGGKNTKTYRENEKSLKKTVTGLQNLASKIRQYPIGPFGYSNVTVGDKNSKKKNLKKEKKQINRKNYLFIDDILPSVSRPVPGILAADIDLQALRLTVDNLADNTVPFDTKTFLQILDGSCYLDTDYHCPIIDEFDNILDIKNYLKREDWESVKELYVEFRSKGILEIYKVAKKVLLMAGKTNKTTSNEMQLTQRIVALKLGIMFLNIFHAFYMEAAQGTINLDEITTTSNIRSNDEIRIHLPPLEMFITKKNQQSINEVPALKNNKITHINNKKAGNGKIIKMKPKKVTYPLKKSNDVKKL